ncbi:MAG: hypothetical protein ACFFCH_10255 [Promethearchaeota archaeon]
MSKYKRSNWFTKICSILFASLFLFALSMPTVFASALPVVRNPGFETPPGGPVPDFWAFTTTDDSSFDDFQGLYPTTFPHTGSESVGVLPLATEAGDHAEWSQSTLLNISVGTSYNLSTWVWIGGPNLPPNEFFVDIGVIWQNGGGGQVGAMWSPAVTSPTAVWFELFVYGPAAAGSVQATIQLRVTAQTTPGWDSGVVYFDDVEFYPIGGDTDTGGLSPGDHDASYDPDGDPFNEMFQINISAIQEGLTQINFTLNAFGTGNDQTAIAEVDLVHDINEDGIYDNVTEPLLASGAYAQDDGLLLLNTTHSIPQGSSHLFLIVYQLIPNSDAGDTFGFWVNQIRALGQTSMVATNLPGPPYTSAVKTIVGSLLADVGVNSPGDHLWVPNGVTPNVLLQLELFAYAEDFLVNNITIELHGTGGYSQLTEILIVHDLDGNGLMDASETILASAPGASSLTLVLSSPFTAGKQSSEYLLLALVVSTSATEMTTYSLSVIDLGAIGVVDSATTVVNLPVDSSTKTITFTPPNPFAFLASWWPIILASVIILVLIVVILILYRRRT